MGQWLDRALHPANLDLAWRALDDDRAPWLPGIARAAMESERLKHQLILIDAVRSGQYRAEMVRQFTLAKASGGERIISALFLRDKFLQRAVVQALHPLGEALFHPDSYAYRPRRSIYQALSKCRERIHCGLPWLVDGDITAFFDQIPRAPLLRRFAECSGDVELTRLIAAWLNACPSRDGLFADPRGIPQGAVISPFLCNLYLHALDQLWQQQGLAFVRYADDFVLFLPTQELACQALRYTQHGLESLGLTLNPQKTRVIRASRAVQFLGQSITEAPRYHKRNRQVKEAAPGVSRLLWRGFCKCLKWLWKKM